MRALHLDHEIQAESASWAIHCQKICIQLGIECQTQTLNVTAIRGESLEAVARQARLVAYQKTINAHDIILTAQHRDDQAETMLLQLLRGSGLPGLAAMPKLTNLPPGWLARPLLDISRSQLLAYAQEHNLTWIEDPSNHSEVFDRNYLRHRILPLMAKRWPSYSATIARSAGHCAEAQELLDELLIPIMQTVSGQRHGTLSKSALLELEPKLGRAVLRRWIKSHGQVVPQSKLIRQIQEEVLTATPDRSPQVNWGGMEIRRYRDDIFLIPNLPPLPTACINWSVDNEYCDLPIGLGRLRRCYLVNAVATNIKKFNHAAIQVRFGVTGIRCRPPGAKHHYRIKNLYQTYAIPDWLRPYIPLIYFNDELIAIAGVCKCGSFVAAMELEIVWEAPSWVPIS